ncbi:MAG: hypothetical protein JNL57_11625 [Bacteroidetes bacterium]|nr:hypothetical protein [Bacteroidota bacterium]
MGVRGFGLLFLAIKGCLPLRAQHFAQIANGHYSGVHAAKINPAFTAYSHWNWHVNLIGAWGNVNNNYLTLRLPYSAYKFINNGMPARYKSEQGYPTWDSSYLREKLNGRPKHVAASAMLYAPSFVIRVKKNWQIGLVNDIQVQGRIAGVSENLAHALYKEMDTAKGAFNLFIRDAGNTNKLHKMTVSANAWATIGLNISRDLALDHKRHLLTGITLKRAVGLGGAYFQSDPVTVHIINSDSVSLDKTGVRYASYGGRSARGTGADLGIGYVYHKKEWQQAGGYKDRHTLYKYKFGLALLDVGSILYRNADITDISNPSTIGWRISAEQSRYQNAEPGYGLLDSVLNRLPNYKRYTENRRIGLPTRLALSADYQIKPHWFVNAQVVQSLRSRYSIHARHASYLMLAPRFESEWLEVSLPLLLEYDYRAFRAGASVRIGWLYLGTNSLYSFINTRRLRDADFFIGISFGNLPGKWLERVLKEKYRNKKPNSRQDCEKL